MALFSVVDSSFFAGLLHVGFTARIQSVSTGRYFGANPAGKCVLVDIDEAPQWYIVSRDIGSTSASHNISPRCVVATGEPLSPTGYLSLHSGTATLSQAPCTVRVTLPASHASNTDVSFAFSPVRKDKGFVSVCKGPGQLSLRLGKSGRDELFKFAVDAGSIGRGMIAGGSPYISAPQALTIALLELGTRFRLRSVHGRVLSRSPQLARDRKEGDRSAATKRVKRKDVSIYVRQDGSKSRVDESFEEELVFEATKVSGKGLQDGFDYMFTDVNNGGVLSIRTPSEIEFGTSSQTSPSGFDSEGDFCRNAVAIVRLQNGRLKGAGSGFSVTVTPAEKGWGGLHIGSQRTGGSAEATAKTDWLMAGPRGRLETRNHRGPWESFNVEIVEQSFNAALREMPPSGIVSNADASDRASVRAEIAAQVAAARKSESPTRPKSGKKETKGAFDHAAALSGLSGLSEEQKHPQELRKSVDNIVGGSSGKYQKAGGRKSVVSSPSSSAAADVSPPSSLPRHSAAKKANKRGKKKGKQQQQQQHQRAQTANPASSGGQSSARQASKTSESNSSDKNHPLGSPTNSSLPPGSGSGPSCAACGRPITGAYTKAQGKNFHQQCFCCRACRRPLLPGAGQFREHGGVPYCNGCYASSIAPKCARCAKPIMETVTTAMEKTWHKDCLTCVICRLPLTQQFWLYADKPNEPRCSRCVTGSEEAVQGMGYGRRDRRAVNLPGLIRR